ncbi:MAG: DUF5615 family PIN-like protein, partial [bacterium]
MKFLADQNVRFRAVLALRKSGYDILHTTINISAFCSSSITPRPRQPHHKLRAFPFLTLLLFPCRVDD